MDITVTYENLQASRMPQKHVCRLRALEIGSDSEQPSTVRIRTTCCMLVLPLQRFELQNTDSKERERLSVNVKDTKSSSFGLPSAYRLSLRYGA